MLVLWGERGAMGSSAIDGSGRMGRTFSGRLDWTWCAFVSDVEERIGRHGARW